MTGKFIQTCLEHLQIEIGSFTSFLHLDFKAYGFLVSPSWITVLWEFISSHNITLCNTQPKHPQPLRFRDKAIMDILIQDGTLSRPALCSINRVRCHLQVYSMADIATGDGLRLQQNIHLGLQQQVASSWDWHEECPSPHDVSCWRRAMPFLSNAQHVLHNSLGNWLALPHKQWCYYLEMQSSIIFHRSGDAWTSFHRGRAATRTNLVYFKSDPQVLPSTALSHATVIILSETSLILEGTDYTDVSSLPKTTPFQCDSFWCLDASNIKDEYNKEWISTDLRHGTILAVCDGSYKPRLTPHGITAAFVLESQNKVGQIFGTVATSGITSDAYRGELLGIYAILSAVGYIERYNHQFTTGILQVGCDNEKAGWISGLTPPTPAVQ